MDNHSPQQAVGVVFPLDPDETEATARAELAKLTPRQLDVRVAFQVMPTAEDGAPLTIDAGFVEDAGADPIVIRLAEQLVERGAGAVAHAITSATFARGRRWAEERSEQLSGILGVPATSTSLASIEALRALGVSRVAVATPYVAEVNDRLVRFLAEWQIDVTELVALHRPTLHATTPTADIRAAAVTAVERSPNAQAVFISCTGQKVADIIEGLERELDLPVVTANQATLWQLARLVGAARADGPGALYRSAAPG